MPYMLAALWILHGVALFRGWGQFRPSLGLLHGLGMGVVGFVLIAWGAPAWMVGVAGAAIGAVGAVGHRLAPGLWVGVGLLGLALALALPGITPSGAVIFSLAGEMAAGLVAAGRTTLQLARNRGSR